MLVDASRYGCSLDDDYAGVSVDAEVPVDMAGLVRHV